MSTLGNVLADLRAYRYIPPCEPAPPPPKPKLDTTPRSYALRKSVCERHGITVEQLNSPCRAYKIVAARRDLAKELSKLKWSSLRIGRFMRRDHSTILYYFMNEGPRRATETEGVR